MKRKLAFAALASLALGAGGGLAWWTLRPPPPAPQDERSFEDIPKEEYEQWMQELGYTE